MFGFNAKITIDSLMLNKSICFNYILNGNTITLLLIANPTDRLIKPNVQTLDHY